MKNKIINIVKEKRFEEKLNMIVFKRTDMPVLMDIKNYFDNTVNDQIDMDIYLSVYRIIRNEYSHRDTQYLLGK